MRSSASLIASASRGAMKRPRGGPFAPQIDRLDMRQMRPAEALGQRQPPIAAAPRVDLGLDRGRRRGEHDRDLRRPRPHHRHVARVVVDAVLLLVGRVVLLIDHDQAEVGVGQEQRRARPGDKLRLAFGDGGPGAGAPARRNLRMPFGRPHAEAQREAVEELPGERDLGHQDQGLPAGADRLGDRLEIDFRFARAGDAVDQRHRVSARLNRRGQRIRGLPLRGEKSVGR